MVTPQRTPEQEIARLQAEVEYQKQMARIELARLRHSIRKELDRETVEMRLCLDRPEPNIVMALHRVENLEYLSQSLQRQSDEASRA